MPMIHILSAPPFSKADEVVKGRWYPEQPPALPDETLQQYTDRCAGAQGPSKYPYDHWRWRQCGIGWHGDCSFGLYGPVEQEENPCACPCHETPQGRAVLAAARARWAKR